MTSDSDRVGFDDQLAVANIIRLDEGHDRFEYTRPVQPIAGSRYTFTLSGRYADADGADVNVIVHLVDDHLSWAERFRYLSEPIQMWPPEDASTFKLDG